jgi:PAS domain S-box-containing protein
MLDHRAEARPNTQVSFGDGFRAAFEHAPVGLALTSATDDDANRFIQVNATLAGLLGYSPHELEGELVADFTHPEDRSIELETAPTTGGPARLQKRYLHASGRTVSVNITYSLVGDLDSDRAYFVLHVEDASAHKDTEQALLAALAQQNDAARNLRKIDQVRTEMVATISHELRTPLTSILGYVEILTDGDAGELNDEQSKLIETIGSGTRRLNDLANDLLTLAEMDASSPEGSDDHVETVDIGALAVAAVDVVSPMIAAKQQILVSDLPGDAVYVRGDPLQLDRAVVNLLSNASKYTNTGGNIRLTVHSGGGEVHVVVDDDGIGIPKAEQEKLFERFFRASAAQELAIKGTGLGLAIVKSIVDRHEGRIKVDSAPGKGSTFTITLPTVVPVPAGHH